MTKAQIEALFMDHLDDMEDDFRHCDVVEVLSYLAQLVYDEIVVKSAKGAEPAPPSDEAVAMSTLEAEAADEI